MWGKKANRTWARVVAVYVSYVGMFHSSVEKKEVIEERKPATSVKMCRDANFTWSHCSCCKWFFKIIIHIKSLFIPTVTSDSVWSVIFTSPPLVHSLKNIFRYPCPLYPITTSNSMKKAVLSARGRAESRILMLAATTNNQEITAHVVTWRERRGSLQYLQHGQEVSWNHDNNNGHSNFNMWAEPIICDEVLFTWNIIWSSPVKFWSTCENQVEIYL